MLLVLGFLKASKNSVCGQGKITFRKKVFIQGPGKWGSALLNIQIFGARFWTSETSAPVLVDEAGASLLA